MALKCKAENDFQEKFMHLLSKELYNFNLLSGISFGRGFGFRARQHINRLSLVFKRLENLLDVSGLVAEINLFRLFPGRTYPHTIPAPVTDPEPEQRPYDDCHILMIVI